MGQHSFAAGSPSPICTNPPSRSTHAPSFSASIGHVATGGDTAGGGGGHGVPGGLGLTGGSTGTGGRGIGGRVIGGLVIGGRITGGLTIGGRVTGGFTIGGRVTGGRVVGLGGDFGVLGLGLGLGLGLWWWEGSLPQGTQSRIGVAEEMKNMEMRRRAVSLVVEVSIFGNDELSSLSSF